MRGLVLVATVLVAAVALGCASAVGSATRLVVVVRPNGAGSLPVHRYVLRCGPARGTVPHPGLACRTLARLAHPFAPVPRGTICSDIALGPQQAHVTGRLRGRRVDARLRLAGSCQIDRWHRVRSVVPGYPPGH